MIQQLKILKVVHDPTRQGQDRWKVETSAGIFTCWDHALAEEIHTSLIDQVVEAQIKDSANSRYPATLTAVAPLSSAAKSETNSADQVGHPVAPAAPRYSNDGARVGMAINNAVALVLAGHIKIEANELTIMQPIARAASEIILMAKNLEKLI